MRVNLYTIKSYISLYMPTSTLGVTRSVATVNEKQQMTFWDAVLLLQS